MPITRTPCGAHDYTVQQFVMHIVVFCILFLNMPYMVIYLQCGIHVHFQNELVASSVVSRTARQQTVKLQLINGNNLSTLEGKGFNTARVKKFNVQSTF